MTDMELEAIKYRHQDQVKLLQYLTTFDHRLIAGFLTLQFLLGSFLSTRSMTNCIDVVIIILDLVIASASVYLLHKNDEYRNGIRETVQNCNVALGYEEVGRYLPGKKLNGESRSGTFFWAYFFIVLASLIGLAIVLFRTKPDSILPISTI